MHAKISGTGEYLAEDDADGLRIAREIVAQLPPVEPMRAAGSGSSHRATIPRS